MGNLCNVVRDDSLIFGDSTINSSTGILDEGKILSPAEVEVAILNSTLCMKSVSNFDPATQIILIVFYTALILFGSAGNGLVCYVVLANPQMRTPRNLLILNLATSDLILCLFTQPFNLLKVSMASWKLGTVVCKLVPFAAGTNVFVSTISITAIALDRFKLIVRPTDKDFLLDRFWAVTVFIFIWVFAMILASPMLVFSTTEIIEPYPGLRLYEICLENPTYMHAKTAYSFATMLIQYIVPIVIVSVAHVEICNKLRYRMTSRPGNSAAAAAAAAAGGVGGRGIQPLNSPSPHMSEYQARKQQMEEERKRKTNRLLIMIAVVFAGSWMPLNVFNIIADIDQDWILAFDKNGLVFAICHLLVLGSACANPVLYGWLNDNFRQEFVRILCRSKGDNSRICCCVDRPVGAGSSTVRSTEPLRMTAVNSSYADGLMDKETKLNPGIGSRATSHNTITEL